MISNTMAQRMKTTFRMDIGNGRRILNVFKEVKYSAELLPPIFSTGSR